MFCIIAITAKKKRLADLQVFFIVSAVAQRFTSAFEHGLNGQRLDIRQYIAAEKIIAVIY